MKENFYEARNSIYCYKDTEILVNKLNIQNKSLLSKLERQIVLVKLYELRQHEQIGNFDIRHFFDIHKFLFEDIYPFAGLLRSENIAKDNFRFAEWQYLDDELLKLLEKLKNENFLQNLDKINFAKRLAYYMAELNVLHPFREGNGRTIREFIRQLALKNNYVFSLKNINPREMLLACIKSVANTENLEKIIFDCLEEK